MKTRRLKPRPKKHRRQLPKRDKADPNGKPRTIGAFGFARNFHYLRQTLQRQFDETASLLNAVDDSDHQKALRAKLDGINRQIEQLDQKQDVRVQRLRDKIEAMKAGVAA